MSSKLKNILAVLDLGISARGLARLVGDATMALAASDHETRSLRLRKAKLRLSTELFSSLCRRHRSGFRNFHTFLVDLVSHRCWRYFEPVLFTETAHLVTDTLSSALPDAYRRVDAALGRLMAELPKNSVTIVLSLHGMAGLFRNLRVEQSGLPLFNVHEHGNELIIKLDLERQVPLYEASQ